MQSRVTDVTVKDDDGRRQNYVQLTIAPLRAGTLFGSLPGIAAAAFIGVCPPAAAENTKVSPAHLLIPAQVFMGRPGFTSIPPAPKRTTAPPARPAGGLTQEQSRRLAASIQRMTPKERKQLAKAMKHMTPEERGRLSEAVKGIIGGQRPPLAGTRRGM